ETEPQLPPPARNHNHNPNPPSQHPNTNQQHRWEQQQSQPQGMGPPGTPPPHPRRVIQPFPWGVSWGQVGQMPDLRGSANTNGAANGGGGKGSTVAENGANNTTSNRVRAETSPPLVPGVGNGLPVQPDLGRDTPSGERNHAQGDRDIIPPKEAMQRRMELSRRDDFLLVPVKSSSPRKGFLISTRNSHNTFSLLQPAMRRKPMERKQDPGSPQGGKANHVSGFDHGADRQQSTRNAKKIENTEPGELLGQPQQQPEAPPSPSPSTSVMSGVSSGEGGLREPGSNPNPPVEAAHSPRAGLRPLGGGGGAGASA
ncbi:unnamed protein product, partial [Discosporangium mesarthrocarpum]